MRVRSASRRSPALSRIVAGAIHDISRTELNRSGLPRFNMPLELGLFLGARRFGADAQRRKSCLVLDRQPHRFQEFISDISGQDISSRGDDVRQATRAVRDWLATERAGMAHPPGGAATSDRFERFMADLPAICAETERRPEELTFIEFADAVSTWLRMDQSMMFQREALLRRSR